MSTFQSSFIQSSNGDDGRSQLREIIGKKWPSVADCLCGTPGTAGGFPSTPPFTVMMFAEGAQLKFCLRSDESVMNCFGTIACPEDGFDGLERALIEGQFSWRAKKDRRRS